jgi:chemotaxis protein methyltransferase CheR
MTDEDFDFLAELLRTRSGISISSEKSRLVENRLKAVAWRLGFKDVTVLLGELKTAKATICRAVIDSMMIHDTSFFRDKAPFSYFRTVMLDALMNARKDTKRLRIWCSAAATGQEAYSIAMVVDALPQLLDWNVEVIATDLSSEIVERAEDGLYTQFEVLRGLPIQMLAKHFRQDGSDWRISPELRAKVHFGVFNLLDSFAPLGIFDVIFCRNVLIYFDQRTKQDVLARLADAMAPESYLVLGAAETVLGLSQDFAPMVDAPGVFMKATRANSPRAAMG